MKIHEYQAKDILKRYGVPVQDGVSIKSMTEFDNAISQLKSRGTNQFVVKSQIHAGGRGKGKVYNPNNRDVLILDGGVKFVTDVEKAREYANKILRNLLVTHQTGPDGKIVQTLFITEGLDYLKEFYVGILLDRSAGKNVIMASTEGGVEIEKVAAETPEKIIKEWVDPKVGFQMFQARRLAFGLGLSGEVFKNFVGFIKILYKAYEESDASLIEINPLAILNDNRVVALDAKITLDDNAMFRHKEYPALRDTNEEDPLEVEASKHSLNYVKLDGNVGCMVNGAGLAMATMDIIKLAGGEPANFLDVGGGASAETVENGFKIILSDPNVKAILVNIFGGIVRCDRVAGGIIEAAKNINIHVPLVVRLEGTNADIAQKMLDESGLNIISAKGFKDAAEKITKVLSN
ncbi:MAG: ADP-forming succinate--CoA ligase subunit beta [Chlorobi bacterium]|nr:ADP-forming succinate--CoA ligase subunit beta [Chlorobiota bacterium]MCI0717150.1 ADP-forming succinate--CoA ligase subunit beta [Chlorobiota bacterium]